MSTLERTIEEFDVLSADGQRIRVRRSYVVQVLHNPNDSTLPTVRLNRTVYCAVARGGLERPAESLGEDRFRIAGKEFARLRSCNPTVVARAELHI